MLPNALLLRIHVLVALLTRIVLGSLQLPTVEQVVFAWYAAQVTTADVQLSQLLNASLLHHTHAVLAQLMKIVLGSLQLHTVERVVLACYAVQVTTADAQLSQLLNACLLHRILAPHALQTQIAPGFLRLHTAE